MSKQRLPCKMPETIFGAIVDAAARSVGVIDFAAIDVDEGNGVSLSTSSTSDECDESSEMDEGFARVGDTTST